MAITATDFYRSSNGDRWQLIRDTALGRSFVRHEPKSLIRRAHHRYGRRRVSQPNRLQP
jgi:hypothetical protein